MKLADDVKQRKQKHFKQNRTAKRKLTNKENVVRFLQRGMLKALRVKKSYICQIINNYPAKSRGISPDT